MGPRVLSPLSLALLTAALVFHFLPFPWEANRFDAGIAPVAAMRILNGDVPYADFQTLYTPGHYYLTAAAFRVFGAVFDVASYLNFAVMGVQAWAAWHLAARLSGSKFVAMLAFFAGLAFSYPYPSLVLAFAALVVANRAVERDSLRLAAAAGAVAGVAAWFRQDFGFAAALAVGATVWTGTMASRGTRIARVAAAGAASAVTLALLLLPAIVRAPERLWEGLVVNPAATVPFRSGDDGLLAIVHAGLTMRVVAALALVGGGLAFVRVFGRPDPTRGLLAGTGVLALAALRYLCLRPETHHVVPAGLLVGVLASVPYPRACGIRFVAFLAIGLAILFPLRTATSSRGAELLGSRDAGVATLGDVLPGSSTLYLPSDEAETYARLVRRVRELVPEGGTFLSACSRHDRIHDQDVLLYFAAGRPAVPFDWHFDPGITTREDVQRRIVADCERAGVRVVVRFRSAPDAVLDAMPEGSHVLDEWIAANFAAGETFGRYVVWVRR
jgi:hypothetical protein